MRADAASSRRSTTSTADRLPDHHRASTPGPRAGSAVRSWSGTPVAQARAGVHQARHLRGRGRAGPSRRLRVLHPQAGGHRRIPAQDGLKGSAPCACTSAPTTPASSSRTTSSAGCADARPRAGRPRPVRLRRPRRLPGVLPARRRGASPTERRGSLGVVIGGSGNGEQIAANKVKGVRAALVWSEETAVLAREHNDANVVSVGGRMHTLEDMTRFVEVFLDHRRSPARSATSAGSACSATTRRPATCRRCPSPRSAARGRSERRMPEGHTLRRLADELDRGVRGRAVAVSSPQGRFAESRPRSSTAPGWSSRRGLRASTCSSSSRASAYVHVHLGLIGKFDCHDGAEPPDPRRTGPAADRRGRRRPAYADLRGATACDLRDRRSSARPWSPGSARTRCAPTRTRPGLGADLAQPRRRSATC